MTGSMKPSDILGLFAPSTQAAAGLIIYALADQLAVLSEHELAAFGVVVAGDATGWLGPNEVPYPRTAEDVERVAEILLDRLQSAGLWERELRDGNE